MRGAMIIARTGNSIAAEIELRENPAARFVEAVLDIPAARDVHLDAADMGLQADPREGVDELVEHDAGQR